MPDKPLLQVIDLKKYFPFGSKKENRAVKAVDGVSFLINEGKTFGLVGESGCGKTTTGKCILRIHVPTDGKIIFDGVDIADMSDRELAPIRRDIQLIFQDPYGSLDPRQSIGSILKEAITADHAKHSKDEINSRIKELLEMVELSFDMRERYPHELSGGQRQRLGIARALACKPRLIVCDEPVSALDVSIQAQVINLLKELKEKYNLTFLLITHDMSVIRYLADRVAIMYLGEIIETGKTEDIFTSPFHPYTKALLSSVPQFNKSGKKIILKGDLPSPANLPEGCKFHTRCPYVMEKCKTCTPNENGITHKVKCFLFE